jgi:UDP-N-acetylmuramoyl-tripeptide--D-alanyl-D-alanine ligase
MSIMTTLSDIQAMLPGSALLNISEADAQHLTLSNVGTDSRQVESAELFIALAGERFDAHDYLADVAQAGAGAALISKREFCPEQLPAVCVNNTRLGLGALAKSWRAKFSLPLVLVTGSNGKTTVKEMIASIFKVAVGEQHALVTQGNLNNEIGLPLTLLRLRPSDRLAVIELGMNHPGETAELAAIAGANIALINNAQREHQEFMATVAAVAEEHADVLRALPKDGVAIFPADSEFDDVWRTAAQGRQIIDFVLLSNGVMKQAAVMGRLLSNGQVQIETKQGSIEIQLKTMGNHNVRNALAATAVALGTGISLENIKAGLEAFTPVTGRMQAKSLDANHILVDDSYNANPDSVRAAIDALKQSTGFSWLVLGDMGEVGDQGPAFHREVGAYAAAQGIARLFALGEQSLKSVDGFNEVARKLTLSSTAEHFSDVETLNTVLLNALQAESGNTKLTILVKGSRFMRMERVAKALLEEAKTCS